MWGGCEGCEGCGEGVRGVGVWGEVWGWCEGVGRNLRWCGGVQD